MNKLFIAMAVMLLAIAFSVSAHDDDHGDNGHHGVQKVYGFLPYENLWYTRLPEAVYHTSPGLVSDAYDYGYVPYGQGYSGYGNSYFSQREFLGNPGFHPGLGFYAERYSAKIHNYHAPVLYPGLYRFYPLQYPMYY